MNHSVDPVNSDYSSDVLLLSHALTDELEFLIVFDASKPRGEFSLEWST